MVALWCNCQIDLPDWSKQTWVSLSWKHEINFKGVLWNELTTLKCCYLSLNTLIHQIIMLDKKS